MVPNRKEVAMVRALLSFPIDGYCTYGLSDFRAKEDGGLLVISVVQLPL